LKARKETGKRENGAGKVVQDTTFREGKKLFSPALKVPRQCLIVLLAEIRLREGDALGAKR
jgi:hypothetical protein